MPPTPKTQPAEQPEPAPAEPAGPDYPKSVDGDKRTIQERIVAILAELPPIDKTQRNTQQNFDFRGFDDVLNALNPILARHGVFLIPDVVARTVAHRSTRDNKTMYEVNLHVRFTFHGLAGDSLTGSAWGEGTDMGDKATSKAMTMAFKYFINQAFAISNKEAADPDASSPEDTVANGAGGGTQQQHVKKEDLATTEEIDAYLGEVDNAGYAVGPAGEALKKESGGEITKKVLAAHRKQLEKAVKERPSS